nr:hypothetical protein [Tanacetum cinerariifolium]
GRICRAAAGRGLPGARRAGGALPRSAGGESRPGQWLCGPRWPFASRGGRRVGAPALWLARCFGLARAGAAGGAGGHCGRPGDLGAHGRPPARLGALAATGAGPASGSARASRPTRSRPELVDRRAIAFRGKFTGGAPARRAGGCRPTPHARVPRCSGAGAGHGRGPATGSRQPRSQRRATRAVPRNAGANPGGLGGLATNTSPGICSSCHVWLAPAGAKLARRATCAVCRKPSGGPAAERPRRR